MQYGLVGYPLEHSFSQRYFADKFAKEGLDAEYLNFELKDIRDIRDLLLHYPELHGFNVTIPHKQEIIPFLDTLSDEAQKIGAVNCVSITRSDGKIHLTGYNTDAYGFRNSLLPFIPVGIAKALVLGNGGAAKAVRYVLGELGMDILTVSRTPVRSSEISYPELKKYLPDFKLIINTTPLGTWPDTESCPDLPYSYLTPEHYLFDLTYNPLITTFMQRGSATGAHTHNGLEMLHGQAERAWEVWRGERGSGRAAGEGLLRGEGLKIRD